MELISKFSFDRIYVLESLPDEDRKTGTDLYEHLRYQEYKHDFLKVYLREIDSVLSFIKVFAEIIEDCKQNHSSPVIHFEIHGNENGIRLCSGEFVDWYSFADCLREVNYYSRFNLFITLAVCNGMHLMKTMVHNKPAPYYMALGSFKELSSGSLSADFETFYDEFFDSLDIEKAVNALEIANPNEKNRYSCLSADGTFSRVFLSYLAANYKSDMKRKNAKKQIDSRVAFLARRSKRAFQKKFLSLEKSVVEDEFQKGKKVFFMMDYFPEIGNRVLIPKNLTELKKIYSSLRIADIYEKQRKK